QAETPLYYLEIEIRRAFPKVHLVVVVGSVTVPATVSETFSTYHPHRVFHAAAYKHVPMMQNSPRAAVRTNVVGTYMIGKAAAEAGAEAFLLVSTDKAVRPFNIMGASKHLAERVCLHLQGRYPSVSYRAVRFGNVLGSNGSVIPLFRKQIAAGEPLTVTHEEVTRYFMTIPEAVQLILKASVLPESRGKVSMLDMGEPMRILDLARNLLRLMGHPYRLGQNVVITSLRPGEKLHEELSAPDEQVFATTADRVAVVETAPEFGDLPVNVVGALVSGEAADLLAYLLEAFPVLERRSRERSAILA
ncbi:MAG: polysaccharide biosynthesis protein, partial [Gemmatimonadetes bacterium]|nr:polysaccharide biosynthesis protein [Gemmatimonadota bacterium]